MDTIAPVAATDGWLQLVARLAERFGARAVGSAGSENADDLDEAGRVLTLYVPWSKLDEASRATASICVDLFEEFGQDYHVIVLAEKPEEEPL